jgi:hypothetical protein
MVEITTEIRHSCMAFCMRKKPARRVAAPKIMFDGTNEFSAASLKNTGDIPKRTPAASASTI